MSAEAAERTKIPEIKRVVLDPQSLIANNPTLRHLDPGRYAAKAGNKFDTDRYEKNTPQVCRVFSPDSPTRWVYKIVDGHHRFAGAISYIEGESPNSDTPATPHPDYELFAHDMTDSFIAEKYHGQEYLTPEQFGDEVIEPTIAHAQLVAPRIATGIFSQWRAMVGPEVADKFSALAALTILNQEDLKDNGEKTIRRQLKKTSPLLADGTDKQHEQLSDGLIGVAELIRKTPGKKFDDINSTAIRLFTPSGETSDRLFGVNQQVAGLFSLQPVDQKLRTDNPDKEKYDHRRGVLEMLLCSALTSTTDTRELRAVQEALMNPELTYTHLVTILPPPTDENEILPYTTRLNKIKKAINVDKVETKYKDTFPDGFSQTTSHLIDKICGTSALTPAKVEKYVSEINMAVTTIDTARTYRPCKTDQKNAIERSLRQSSLAELRIALKDLNQIFELPTIERETPLPTEGITTVNATRGEPTTVYQLDQTVPPPQEKILVENEKPPKSLAEASREYLSLLQKGNHELTEDELGLLRQVKAAIESVLPRPRPSMLPARQPDRSAQPRKPDATAKPLPEKTTSTEKPRTTGPIDWESVQYDDAEGTLAWFQGKEYDPAKATKMLDDAAKTVFKDHEVINNWDTYRQDLTFKMTDGSFVTGLDAINEGIQPKVVAIAKKLGLNRESREFAYMAAAFYAHTASIGERAKTIALGKVEDSLWNVFEAYGTNHKKELGEKGQLFQFLIYAPPDDPMTKQILDTLPDYTTKLKKDFKEHTRNMGGIARHFLNAILGTSR